MGPTFGIKTSPSQVAYEDVLRVWEEADAIGAIGHAWLFDHLMPIDGDRHGSAHESWTMLAELAARTGRLCLGHIVTSNRFRPPAVLARIATEVDVVSGGRLVLGLGAGSAAVPGARRWFTGRFRPDGSGPGFTLLFTPRCRRLVRARPKGCQFPGTAHGETRNRTRDTTIRHDLDRVLAKIADREPRPQLAA